MCSLPFHPHCVSSFSQYGDVVKNLMKSLPPIYLAVDTNCLYAREFMIAMSLMLLVWCVLVLKLFEPYWRKQRTLSLVIPPIVLWIWLATAYHSYSPLQTEGLFYVLLALPIVVAAWIGLAIGQRRRAAQVNASDLKTESDLVRYSLEYIRNLEEQDDPECRLWLKSNAQEHYERCVYASCSCQKLMTSFSNRLETTSRDWCELLKNIIEAEMLARFEDSARLNLILAYLYLCRLGHKYRSIYHVNRIDDCDPGLFLQLQSYFFRSFLQEHIDH